MTAIKALGLLIDDEPSMHEIVKEGLDDFCFLHAHSFDEALNIVNSSIKFQFILLDYKLGHKKGTELVSHIKKYHKRCPVLMVSAFGQQLVLKEVIESKVDTFIDKPIVLDHLRDQICKFIDHKGESFSPGYRDHLDFVKNDSDPGLNLKTYAKDEYLSYKYLCRRYKEVHGTSYQVHKRNKIIKKAKEELRETYKPIKHIAYDLGYKNPSAFMVFFKKHVGITAKQFREQATNKAC